MMRAADGNDEQHIGDSTGRWICPMVREGGAHATSLCRSHVDDRSRSRTSDGRFRSRRRQRHQQHHISTTLSCAPSWGHCTRFRVAMCTFLARHAAQHNTTQNGHMFHVHTARQPHNVLPHTCTHACQYDVTQHTAPQSDMPMHMMCTQHRDACVLSTVVVCVYVDKRMEEEREQPGRGARGGGGATQPGTDISTHATAARRLEHTSSDARTAHPYTYIWAWMERKKYIGEIDLSVCCHTPLYSPATTHTHYNTASSLDLQSLHSLHPPPSPTLRSGDHPDRHSGCHSLGEMTMWLWARW